MVTFCDELKAAAAVLSAASRECAAAEDEANRAYQRLEASPDTLEYQIAYSDARKREATAALRKHQAQAGYME